MGKTIAIDPVTRIEGHARVRLDLGDDGSVSEARLIVNELRGFERILVGMEADRMPLVTARICGVCPSAHHLASVKALEAALGIVPPPAAVLLRELLYAGHYIHSHALSLFVLAGPDLVFGLDADPAIRNIVGVVKAAPEVAKKALALRSLGQRINELVGGRGIHPVTAVIGGTTFDPAPDRVQALRKMADESLVLAQELGKVVKELLAKRIAANPDILSSLEQKTFYMGTVKDGKADFYDGRIRVVDASGAVKAEFGAADYEKHVVEKALDWSYMKPVYALSGGREEVYRVGALARLNCADAMATPQAQAELDGFRKAYGRPCHLAVPQVQARVVELLHACEKAQAIAADPAIRGERRVPVRFREGRGIAHVEAPRGTLFHDYEVDAKGIVRAANLIVATQQNYAAINASIKQAAGAFVAGKGDGALLNAVEFAIRSYDPCLSCATHAAGRMPLEIEVRRDGKTVRRLGRTP